MNRLFLLVTNYSTGILLLLVLCLGAQNNKNPEDFYVLNLAIDKSVSLPSGYWIGGSIILGLIAGGTTAAISLPVDSSNSIWRE